MLWTKRDYRIGLKTFYQWLYNYEHGQHPPIVKWIRARSNIPNGLKKSDMLRPEEIQRLVNATTNIRDKAVILVLAESELRLGEILTLRIGDIEFDRMGVRMAVEGKMGRDYSRIISSSKHLVAWLRLHPAQDNPQAPLWRRLESDRLQQMMTYASARAMLQDCIKRAGLSKRVWFYLFRHSRGTFASTKLNSQQLCALMCWKQGSKMPSVYIHLAGDDIDEAQAILNGIAA